MDKSKFSLSERIKSFGFAIKGLKLLFREEHNARIHLAATLVAIVLGIVLDISVTEWIAIILCIGMVISLEALNSAMERLSDYVCGEQKSVIGQIKDLSSAAVLIGAIAALSVGLVIFLPKIISYFRY